MTVTNDKIFEPVYNYTRDFPYIWEEIKIPITYKDDRKRVKEILIEAAGRHAFEARSLGESHLRHMQERYAFEIRDLDPRGFYRPTDNWIELVVPYRSMEFATSWTPSAGTFCQPSTRPKSASPPLRSTS